MNGRSIYHSPLREAQAAATRERILTGCVSLLQAGVDLTYEAVARQSGVQTRTVFRHFPTKADLEVGVWGWIVEHLTHASLTASTGAELIAAMRESFAGFDAGAPLIEAMLHSAQGQGVRLRQQSRRTAMFEACVDHELPRVDPTVRRQVAAALQVLYSAPAWELLRTFCSMNGDQAADTIELAIRALLAGLRAGEERARRDRSPRARAAPARRSRAQQSAPASAAGNQGG